AMGISPHKLRHTAATLMYRYGNSDVRVLKEILGHANLATTEIYTHVSNEQVQNAIDSSPLAKRKQEYSPALDEDNKKEK
ncbi:MAG: tyrosine-type recombinase/integrase, partial [Oscillospiraceae bacterium]